MRTAPLFALVTLQLACIRAAAAQSAEPTFDGLDRNHDGVLSKDEVAAMFEHMNGSGGRPSGGAGMGGAGGGFGHGMHGGGMVRGGGGMPHGTQAQGADRKPNVDQLFKSWDKDGNGTISREEFDARPRGGRRGHASVDDSHAPPHL